MSVPLFLMRWPRLRRWLVRRFWPRVTQADFRALEAVRRRIEEAAKDDAALRTELGLTPDDAGSGALP